MSDKRFEKLLEPYHIGPVKTKNRLIKTGASMRYWDENDLHMSNRVLAMYEAIARGGVGMIIVESPTIDYPWGVRWKERYRIDDDKYINGLSEMTKLIHSFGCPTFMQMNHDGPWPAMPPWQKKPVIPGKPIAASPVCLVSKTDLNFEEPRELSIPEIKEKTDKFASAAVRAAKAGFDGVDINVGSTHLLHTFLSPFWNRRQDAYGGSTENRTRFVTEIIQEIKKRLGRDFPVIITMNGFEVGQTAGIENSRCIPPEEGRRIAKMLEQAGAAAIQARSQFLGYHIASFFTESLFYPEPPLPLASFPEEYDCRHHGKGANVPLAAAVKKVVSIPIITVGRLDPILGEKALREGKADFIGFTRRLLADPELPNKIASGRYEDIAPCTADCTCMDSRVTRHCRINALLGTDEPYVIKPAEKKKKVVVIGGGPAGMEAARTAALRGHEVILFEKSQKPGGLLPLAALVKGTEIEDLPAIVRYLSGQVTKLGVKINLGQEADAAAIEQLKPDAVILATGGIPVIPDIPGINNRKVISSTKLHGQLKFFLRFMRPETLRWLTRFWMPIGKRVVVIGGKIQGAELAEFLVKRDRQVTIIETGEVIGEGLVEHLRLYLLGWFEKKSVTAFTQVKNMEITDKGVTVVTKEGGKQTIEADSIVTALPLSPDTALRKSLEGKVSEIYAVGDCHEPSLIVDAIGSGSRVARVI